MLLRACITSSNGFRLCIADEGRQQALWHLCRAALCLLALLRLLQKVRDEFWRQTKLSLGLLLVFLVVAWVARGRPPWA